MSFDEGSMIAFEGPLFWRNLCSLLRNISQNNDATFRFQLYSKYTFIVQKYGPIHVKRIMRLFWSENPAQNDDVLAVSRIHPKSFKESQPQK